MKKTDTTITRPLLCKMPLRSVIIHIFLLLSFCAAVPALAREKTHEIESVVLQLRWYHQFQFAGYYAAIEKGFYWEAGLEVTLIEGGGGKNVIDEVLHGPAHYGVSNSEILLHRLQNKPLVVLAAILQHSPIALLVRADSGIHNLQELTGKRVKMSTTSRDIELQAIFQNEGISLEQIQLVDGFASNEDYFDDTLDAVAAYATNQPFYLTQKGLPFRLIQPSTYGIDFYGDCLFTSEEEIDTHPERVKAFREASLRGWEYAMKHPEEVVEIILSCYATKKTREHLLYEAEAMRKLILPELIELGHMNPGRWRHIAETFADFELIDADYSFGRFLYDPDPAQDYSWLGWTAGITLFLSVFGGGVAATLFVANRRLTAEIAERKTIEEQLKKASEDAQAANRAKSRFLANMSHELRTPLNAVIGFSQLLLDRSHLEAEDRNTLQTIHQNGEQLLTLINQILDLSGIGAGRIELYGQDVDLYEMLDTLKGQEIPMAPGKVLTPASLANLSAEVLAKLEQAIIEIDKQAIGQVQVEIQARNAPLAHAIAELLDDYEYDEILHLIQLAKE